MPSVKISMVTNETYHVYNRGVDKRDIFLDKYDYIRFYQSLHLFNSVEPVTNFRVAQNTGKDNVVKKLVEISSYSLLPNHYHLILQQVHDGGIGEFLRRVSSGYTSYFNEKYGRSGSLFQGTFKRVHISSEEQKQYVFAYVNENHQVHGMVIDRELYHSSSIHYQGKRKSQVIKSESKGYYPLLENIELAKDVYLRRQKMKDLLE